MAVVGATGAVGNQIVELIAARAFHLRPQTLRHRARLVQTVDAGGEEHLIEQLENPADLRATTWRSSRCRRPRALEIIDAQPGPMLIDLSACIARPDVADRVARPNLARADRRASQRKLYAIPNPAAHVLAPVSAWVAHWTRRRDRDAGGVRRPPDMIARTVDQTTDLLAARLDLEEDETQRAFNAFMRELAHGHGRRSPSKCSRCSRAAPRR